MALELLFPPIINEEGRKHILAHKYVPGNQSIMMVVLNPFWEFSVNLVPNYIAPNVLTLTGLILQMIGLYTYSYCDPTFSGTYDSFALYIFEFILLFTYQTLDAIDGKHARNTHNSSPLGQLFDHGCDAIIIGTTAVYASMLGIAPGYKLLYVLLSGQIVFYALNWRARHTAQFDFGQFSVDESMLLGQLLYVFTAFYGTSMWRETTVSGITITTLLLVALSACIIQNCVKAYYHVMKHYANVSSKDKRKFYTDAYYEIGNLIVFDVSLCLWNLVDVMKEHPTMFITIVAVTFAHLIHRLIIVDVTKQKSRKVQYIILPCVAVGVLSAFEYILQKPVLLDVSMKDVKVVSAVLMYSVYVMVVYAMRCMIDISNLLKIRIFLINSPRKVHKK